MENHHVRWVNPLFLWPCSIANFWHNQRVTYLWARAMVKVVRSRMIQLDFPSDFPSKLLGYPHWRNSSRFVQGLHPVFVPPSHRLPPRSCTWRWSLGLGTSGAGWKSGFLWNKIRRSLTSNFKQHMVIFFGGKHIISYDVSLTMLKNIYAHIVNNNHKN